jgi:hypothetical protein
MLNKYLKNIGLKERQFINLLETPTLLGLTLAATATTTTAATKSAAAQPAKKKTAIQLNHSAPGHASYVGIFNFVNIEIVLFKETFSQ